MEKYCDESYYRPVLNRKYDWPAQSANALNHWRQAPLKEKQPVKVPVLPRQVLLDGAHLSMKVEQKSRWKGADQAERTLSQPS